MNELPSIVTSGTLYGDDGKPIPEERADLIRMTYLAFKSLTDGERGMIACWFCQGCWRYVGPGDVCHCMNDE